MATFKLKDKNGVETTYTKSGIKIPNADGTGYVTFSEGLSGAYTVSFSVDGEIVNVVSVKQGGSFTANPFHPIKANYNFIGWSETSGGTPITYPYTPNSDKTLYAIFENGYKSVNSGYGSSNPTSVQYVKDASFPTSFETVVKDGDTFIKIPTMYRKINSTASGQITGFTLSTGKIDNTYEPYPCFLKEDGSLMPYILIGKYMSNSDTTCVSVGTPGQSSGRKAQTIGNGRQKARNRGTGYLIMDWQIQKLWQDLICTIMSTININTDSGTLTDAIGLEWENSGGWIDGIASLEYGNYWTFSYKPSKYVDSPSATTDGYKQVNYSRPTLNGLITALGYDQNEPFVNYPKTVSGNLYTTYYCDAYYYVSGNHPVNSNVGSTDPKGGAFRCDVDFDWSRTYGVRLCYRPIGE